MRRLLCFLVVFTASVASTQSAKPARPPARAKIVNFHLAPVKIEETGKRGFTIENDSEKVVKAIRFVCVTGKSDAMQTVWTFDAYPIRVDSRDTTTELSTGRFWQRDACTAKDANLAIGGVVYADGTNWNRVRQLRQEVSHRAVVGQF
jgi:hypothetical protein